MCHVVWPEDKKQNNDKHKITDSTRHKANTEYLIIGASLLAQG